MSGPIPAIEREHVGPARQWVPDISATVGSTPLVALTRLFDPEYLQVYAKLECFNPGGSIKDRAAKAMIEHALACGAVVPGTSTVIESSSGNLGIALAQVCNLHDLRLICVVDRRTTGLNVDIMRAYGATVEVVNHRDPVTDEFLPTRIKRVRELLAATPNSFWPDQYANEFHPPAHHATMREIIEGLPERPAYVFIAVGTCGTLSGCAQYLRAHRLAVTIVAVDAVGSSIFGPPEPWERRHPRRIPGHGAAVVPPLLSSPDLAGRVVKVSDGQCVEGCRQLLAHESILAGGSSGGIISALLSARSWIEPGALCAAILPDGGDRYLDTIYSDDWVARHIGPPPDRPTQTGGP